MCGKIDDCQEYPQCQDYEPAPGFGEKCLWAMSVHIGLIIKEESGAGCFKVLSWYHSLTHLVHTRGEIEGSSWENARTKEVIALDDGVDYTHWVLREDSESEG